MHCAYCYLPNPHFSPIYELHLSQPVLQSTWWKSIINVNYIRATKIKRERVTSVIVDRSSLPSSKVFSLQQIIFQNSVRDTAPKYYHVYKRVLILPSFRPFFRGST